MAVPALNEFGLLPVGVHNCTLSEIAAMFGGFQRSDKRLKLFERLRVFVDAVWKVDDDIHVVVDGSFIMGKVDEPADVDVILVFPVTWDLSADLPPFKYNIVSKRMVRKLHGFDMLVCIAGETSEVEAFEFFSRVNVKWHEPLGIPTVARKGLIRVQR